MNEQDTSITLQIPGRIQPLQIDMRTAYIAEARTRDIAFVNKGTAPELLSVINEGYIDLARAYGTVHYQTGRMEIERKKRKAILTLDIIPGKAKEAGLASGRSPTGSEDIREAYYYKDPEYVAIDEALAGLEATKELIEIKLRALWNAMDSIKAVIRTNDPLQRVNHTETAPAPLERPPPRLVDHSPQEPTLDLPRRVEVLDPEFVPTNRSVKGFGKANL